MTESEIIDDINTKIYAIIRDIKDFIDKEFHLTVTKSLYASLEEDLWMGMITCTDFPGSEDAPSGVHKIEVKDDYIEITFVYVSMMVSEQMVEDYLCDRWLLCRQGFRRFKDLPELIAIKEKGLGVRLKAFAGIGGEGAYLQSATLFTSEDLQSFFSVH